jgi:hypothetical protein
MKRPSAASLVLGPLVGPHVVIGMLLAGATAFAAVSYLGGDAPKTATVLDAVPLFDDDAGKAMFALPAMAPGVPVSRCIRIGYDGGSDAATVRLAAEAVQGRLADALAVTVDRGTGGGYGDCTGFSGSRIFNGNLTSLGRADTADGGLSTGWQPSGPESQTFRITVNLADPAPAKGADAQARFVWRVRAATNLTPAAPDGFLDTPTPDAPAPDVPATPTAGARVGGRTQAPMIGGVGTAASSAAGTPAPGGAPRPAGAPAPAPEQSQRSEQAAPRTVSSALHAITVPVAKLAREAGRHVAIPLVLILALAVFLLVQHLADRNDPKLRLAPMSRSRYLWINGGNK